MKIINQTNDAVLADSAEKADTVLSRLKGLIGRKDFPAGSGMIITQCRSIHMWFMRFSIDAVFVDRKGVVAGIVENIRPFQISPYFFRARYVIELPAGTVQRTKTGKGDGIFVQE